MGAVNCFSLDEYDGQGDMEGEDELFIYLFFSIVFIFFIYHFIFSKYCVSFFQCSYIQIYMVACVVHNMYF
jgi:hypothetical protein